MQVARRDALHAQVLGGVARKLEDLSGEVLEDGGRVDGSDGANAALVGDAQLEVAVDATDGELEASLGRAETDFLAFSLAASPFTLERTEEFWCATVRAGRRARWGAARVERGQA